MTLSQAALVSFTGLFLATASAVWLHNPRDLRRALSFALGLSGAAWSVTLYLLSTASSPERALLWARLSFWGPSLALLVYSHVVRDVLRKPGQKLFDGYTFLAAASAAAVMAGSFHPEVIRRAAPGLDSISFDYGSAYPFEILGISFLAILTLYQSAAAVRFLAGRERAQAEIMFVGMLVSSVLASVTNLLLPWFGYSEAYLLGPCAYSVGLAATFYAIARHRLFDIEIGMGRLVRTSRATYHHRVRQTLAQPENYLSLATLSESLQEAFASNDFSIALLDREAQATRVFGNSNLPLPSPTLASFKNGQVLSLAELPQPLKHEMIEKSIHSILRLGNPDKPIGLITLGREFENTFFSVQDFALLRFLARQIELVIRISLKAGFHSPSSDRAVGQPGAAATPSRLLVLSRRRELPPSFTDLPEKRFQTECVELEEDFIERAGLESFDLGILFASGMADDVPPIMRRIGRAAPNLHCLVFDPTAASRSVVSGPLPAQILGIYLQPPAGRDYLARMLDSAIAAARFYRGEVNPALTGGRDQAPEDLFPALLTAWSEARDFGTLSRLFQKRLLEHTIRHSKTQAEAARKLGLSAANMSLKLKYLGMRATQAGD